MATLQGPAAGLAGAQHDRPGGPAAGPRDGRRPGGRHAGPPGRQIAVAGAHGGAGASTLAALLRRELAGSPAGRGWQVCGLPAIADAAPERLAAGGWLPGWPPGVPLVLAARGTADGARRAVVAVAALARCGIRPAAIAVIADGAGPEPRQAAQRLDLIAGRAGPLIRVPFAAGLRAGTSPEGIRLSRRLQSALTSILALAVAAPGSRRQP